MEDGAAYVRQLPDYGVPGGGCEQKETKVTKICVTRAEEKGEAERNRCPANSFASFVAFCFKSGRRGEQ